MIGAVPGDILFLCAELMTGKSIPVLVGITRLPVGQGLAWLMVCLGALVGTCFSLLVTRETRTLSLLSFANRLLQLCFSLGLSVSMLLSLAASMHAERGVSLTVIPVFCLLIQPLPQRHSTALVSFLLCGVTFYVCGIMGAIDGRDAAFRPAALSRRASLSAVPSLQPIHSAASVPDTVALTVAQVILRALQLFFLGLYASIQHAPTQLYFDTTGVARPVYASHHHANHTAYSLFVGMISAWLRVCVWSAVCFFQDNPLHAMLEGSNRSDTASWPCCIVYMTALLYSACWTVTQIREQVLPRFFSIGGEDSHAGLHWLVFVVALATLFRQRDPEVMFVVTNALTLIAGVTALFTLKGGGLDKDGGYASSVHDPSVAAF